MREWRRSLSWPCSQASEGDQERRQSHLGVMQQQENGDNFGTIMRTEIGWSHYIPDQIVSFMVSIKDLVAD